MNMQKHRSIERESITITLTPEEYDFLIGQLQGLVKVQSEMPRRFQIKQRNYVAFVKRFYHKLQFLFSNSGDACRHPAQSPDVVGQDGTLISNPDEKIKARTFGLRCRFCEYIYDDAPGCDGCSFNYSFRSPDAVGQGGNK